MILLVMKMKFINENQFRNYFYKKNMENYQDVKQCIDIHARDIFFHLQEKKLLGPSILFLIGPGHNGKLALEVARLCTVAHIRVHVFIAQTTPSKHDIQSTFKQNAEYLQLYYNMNSPRFKSLFDTTTQIIDGLFATGISSKLDQHYTQIIEYINKHAHCEVISLIKPSGMQSVKTETPMIQATSVITLKYPLLSLLTNNFPVKQIICATPSQKDYTIAPTSSISTSIPPHFTPTLSATSHKYNRGLIFSFGGSDFFGSSVLALKSMLKINACMIHHFGDIAGKYPLLTQLPEIIFHNICQSPAQSSAYTHIPTGAVMGFGMLHEQQLVEHFHTLLRIPHFFPIILDAGALDLLDDTALTDEVRKLHPIIMTPHIGEFAQMTKTDEKTICDNKLEMAQTFACEHGVILVLKGDQTLIVSDTQTWINPAGNPLLATPGSGDVLSGVIASHLDQTLTPLNLFERICQAVYRHSLAADQLAITHTNITASQLIDLL